MKKISVVIDAEKCVSQILFDRILDSKSNRKRLDLNQLVKPWLDSVQKHTKQNAIDPEMESMPQQELVYMTSIEPNEMESRKCVDVIANLDHFKFRSWLSEKCVCIYTLEAITTRVQVPKRSHHRVSIMAGKKLHKLDCTSCFTIFCFIISCTIQTNML